MYQVVLYNKLLRTITYGEGQLVQSIWWWPSYFKDAGSSVVGRSKLKTRFKQLCKECLQFHSLDER